MVRVAKPKLVFFQSRANDKLANFILLYRLQQVKCLSEFFEVIVISDDCDYQQICDKYQPDLTLFEHPGIFPNVRKLKIENTHRYLEIPKLGFHNEDAWCNSRKDFIADMDRWGIETFFSLCTTMAERTPEIADNLFVWANFIDSDIYKDYGSAKVIPVLFTGASYAMYPWRQKVYKLISQYYPSLICPHLGYGDRSAFRMIQGEQYARTINASWFVPTCGTAAKEVVRKHFEIPASKACLIAEKSPNLEAAGFVDMQNCVFADDRDVLDKLDYLFQNPDKLESIIDAGYQLVHSHHTLKQRDQILQWFNLHKNLKPNQKIVQNNPFGALVVADKSSEIRSAHIIADGLLTTLLREGDEQLWAGRYDEAESLYLQCLKYVTRMPEPKLRLALCNLYKGNAEIALEWLVPMLQTSLENGENCQPDPVEWAYCIISLLCLGRFDEAVRNANQFPTISHPELDRVRWIINVLKTKSNIAPLSQNIQAKHRYSVHYLPSRSIEEWVDRVCIMFDSCQQFDLAETLRQQVAPEAKLLQQKQHTADIKPISWTEKSPFVSEIAYSINPYPFRNRATVNLRKAVFRVREKLALKTRFLPLLNRAKTWSKNLLPNRSLSLKNDELFQTIQQIAREEKIGTALIVGAAVGLGSTEALLTGIKENQNNPIAFCVNISTPQFIELQNWYSDRSFVKCYEISSDSSDRFQNELDRNVEKIKQENRFDCFDIVLIENSEFGAKSELNDDFSRAKFVILNNTNTIAGYKNYQKLVTDSRYILEEQNPCSRGGYAIFRQVERYSDNVPEIAIF
jgi:tetratricopeptide (TPR) repeat protein